MFHLFLQLGGVFGLGLTQYFPILLRFCGNIHIINVFKEVVFIIYCVCLCFVRRR
jgi:hypothetical protein